MLFDVTVDLIRKGSSIHHNPFRVKSSKNMQENGPPGDRLVTPAVVKDINACIFGFITNHDSLFASLKNKFEFAACQVNDTCSIAMSQHDFVKIYLDDFGM